MKIPSHLDLFLLYRRAPAPVRAMADVLYRVVPERWLRSRTTRDLLAELARSERLRPGQLEALQTERLRALLVHAGAHTRHYRALFTRTGFDPAALRTPRDLEVLPVLTRGDVRTLGDDLLSDAYPASMLYRSNTSGSTGNWLEFWRDSGYYDVEMAFTQRYLQWAGIHMHWRHAIFYRAIMTHPADDHVNPPYERYRNRLILSQFHTDPRSLDAYVRMLDDFRAEYFTIFPTTLLVFTRHCRRHAPGIHRPRVIICYSENLYEEHRREMEAFWGCRIFNRYGHSEGCISAGECEHGGLHLSSEYGYTEVLRDDGTRAEPGEEGRLVATGLYTTAMPFIRYDTGDRGILSPEPCACGRGLPVLAMVDGRGDDIIVTRDGKHVAAYRAIYSDTSGIRLTQIVQERPGEVIIRIVPDDDYDPSVLDVLRANMRHNLGGDFLDIRFELVDDVERTPSGKIRLVLSKLPRTAGE